MRVPLSPEAAKKREELEVAVAKRKENGQAFVPDNLEALKEKRAELQETVRKKREGFLSSVEQNRSGDALTQEASSPAGSPVTHGNILNLGRNPEGEGIMRQPDFSTRTPTPTTGSSRVVESPPTEKFTTLTSVVYESLQQRTVKADEAAERERILKEHELDPEWSEKGTVLMEYAKRAKLAEQMRKEGIQDAQQKYNATVMLLNTVGTDQIQKSTEKFKTIAFLEGDITLTNFNRKLNELLVPADADNELVQLKKKTIKIIGDYLSSRYAEDLTPSLKRRSGFFKLSGNTYVTGEKVAMAETLFNTVWRAENTSEMRDALNLAEESNNALCDRLFPLIAGKGDLGKALAQCNAVLPEKNIDRVKKETKDLISQYIESRSKEKLASYKMTGFYSLMFKEDVTTKKLALANDLLAKIDICVTQEALLVALNGGVDINLYIVNNSSSFTKGDLGKALDKCLALANKAVANVAVTEVVAPAVTVN